MTNLIIFPEVHDAPPLASCHADSWTNLSPREMECVSLLDGFSNKEIASALGLSPDTIRAFLRTASMKLGIHGRKALYAAWVERQGRVVSMPEQIRRAA